MPFEFCTTPAPGTNQRPLNTNIKDEAGSLVAEFFFWTPLFAKSLAHALGRSRTILPRPPKVQEDTESHYIATHDAPMPRDTREVAISFSDKHLMEWNSSLGKPSCRTEIMERFSCDAANKGLSAREVLAKVLVDSREGKLFKQTLKGHTDTNVYKGAVREGLLGRPGSELFALKTMTLKHIEPFADLGK